MVHVSQGFNVSVAHMVLQAAWGPIHPIRDPYFKQGFENGGEMEVAVLLLKSEISGPNHLGCLYLEVQDT